MIQGWTRRRGRPAIQRSDVCCSKPVRSRASTPRGIDSPAATCRMTRYDFATKATSSNCKGIFAQNCMLVKLDSSSISSLVRCALFCRQSGFLAIYKSISNTRSVPTVRPQLKKPTLHHRRSSPMPSELQRGATMHAMGFCICPECPQNRNTHLAIADGRPLRVINRARRRERLCECEWCDLWDRFEPDIVGSPREMRARFHILVGQLMACHRSSAT